MPAIEAARHHHAPERIGAAAVEAGGHDDQLGLELAERRQHHALEGGEIGAGAGARRQRNVEVVAGAGAGAVLLDPAGVQRKEPILMDRHGEHRRVLVEGLLRAVAVMHVPIDRGDAPEPVRRARMQGGDRDIAEQAEAQSAVALGMVAGRADQRVGVAHLALDHRIHGRDGAARGEAGDLEAALAEGREDAGVPAMEERAHRP